VIAGNSDKQYVDAIDVRTGKEKWKHDARVNVFSSPMVSGGIVYVGDWYAHIWFLDLKDGKPKGAYYIEDRVNASPIIADGVVYVGAEDYYFYAFE